MPGERAEVDAADGDPMSASQRRKGARAEVELANLLTERLGVVVKRRLGQERDGGADIHVGEARIQAKRDERPALAAWWRQATDDASDGVPVLAWRQSRRPWTFRVPLSALLPDADEGLTCDMGIDAFEWFCRERML